MQVAANKSIVSTEKASSYKYVKKPTIQLEIHHRIEEFEKLTTELVKDSFWSEEVSSELVPRAVWLLEVYPNGESEEHEGYISIYLYLTGPMRDNGENLDAICHIYLVDGSRGSRIDVLGRSTTSRTWNFGKESYYLWAQISHDRAKKALQANGSLHVAANVSFLAPDNTVLLVDLHKWPTKFSKFYGNRATSDCRIEIGGAAIWTHKLPLMACSPAFEEMFTNPAAEEFQTGVVKVNDFKEPEPMRALVRYCYQGLLDDATMDGKWALEIFKLAAKYCIDDLQALLERHFIDKRLSVENVIEMAVLADSYFAPNLKEACIELIAREGETVFESAEWKRLERTRQKLGFQLAIAAYHEK